MAKCKSYHPIYQKHRFHILKHHQHLELCFFFLILFEKLTLYRNAWKALEKFILWWLLSKSMPKYSFSRVTEGSWNIANHMAPNSAICSYFIRQVWIKYLGKKLCNQNYNMLGINQPIAGHLGFETSVVISCARNIQRIQKKKSGRHWRV